MTAETELYVLPEAIKMEECQALDQFLRETAGKNIQLDGGAVDKLGGVAAQLIAAHQTIRAQENTRITIKDPSDRMIAALDTLDLNQVLATEGAAE